MLPLPFNQTFKYLCDEDEKVELGSFVSVPFKNKMVTGCIWENKSRLQEAKKVQKLIQENEQLLQEGKEPKEIPEALKEKGLSEAD